MLTESFLAGLWASIGSAFGKLSGEKKFVGDNYVLYIAIIVAMIIFNTWGCRYYVLSLDASGNSVLPTVISAASNYVISGLVGLLLFGEAWTWQWWIGAFFVICGLTLLTQEQSKSKIA